MTTYPISPQFETMWSTYRFRLDRCKLGQRHWLIAFFWLVFVLSLRYNANTNLGSFDAAFPENSYLRGVGTTEFVELGRSNNSDSPNSTFDDQGKNVPGKRQLSVVLRTWHEDAAMALLGLESVVNIIDQQLLEVVIVTDVDSEQVVRADLYRPLIERFWKLYRRNGIRLRVEPNLLRNGHIQQKYSKMTADTYTTGDFILHLDSDCVITQWKDECFLENDKPVNDFATFESLRNTGVGMWKEGTEIFLGIRNEKYEFSRLNQHVYPRLLYSLLRKRAETVHGRPFLEIFDKLDVVGTFEDKLRYGYDSTLLISDFNLLGATAFHFAPKLMTSKNLTDDKTSWRPICVAQCNARKEGAECCEKWLAMQTRLAAIGEPTSAHVSCKTDFSPDDSCYCHAGE